MVHNFKTAAGRARIIETVGADEYNRLHEEYRERQVVATVAGRRIRRVETQRYGVIFMVEGLSSGCRTQAEAEKLARQSPL